ncbi:hypothetical protein [Rhodanobacter sp. C05]|jgi:hypothetical protein|uniref:hypothetical protein n=1 Tax=Rhodanobacter sp. C05 TaxID=1945855 RepID=UPI000986EE5A|nr:hypothetical protein [Rhodanobacter sp. C05]OOG40203.1 hypothetical protein B0E51_10150 [Rhodanobacter sp. C05]
MTDGRGRRCAACSKGCDKRNENRAPPFETLHGGLKLASRFVYNPRLAVCLIRITGLAATGH